MNSWGKIVIGIGGLGLCFGCASRSPKLSRDVRQEIAHIEQFRRQNLQAYPQLAVKAERLFARAPVMYPDSLYARQYDSLPAVFLGESGFDIYCVWLTDYLAQSLGNTDYRTERNTLYDIFYTLNDLLKEGSENGTLFQHAGYRIPAYTEYYLHRYHDWSAPEAASSTDVEQTMDRLRKVLERYRSEEHPGSSPASSPSIDKRVEYIRSLLTNRPYVNSLQAYLHSWETLSGSL